MNFSLTDKEEKLYHNFYKKHKSCREKLCENDDLMFCPSGIVSITFTQTGVGNIVEVKCSLCGDKEDITDYNMW